MNDQNSFGAMLAIISAVRDARIGPALMATVVTTRSGVLRSVATARVSLGDRLWSLIDENSASAFHPESGWTISHSDGVVETLPRERDDWIPPRLRLFFPLSLPIWGEQMDSWRVIDAEVSGRDAHLRFQHKENAEFFGRATIDLEWGIATEFTEPWERTTLQDIKSPWQ